MPQIRLTSPGKIPARAGTTSRTHRAACPTREDPRAGGDDEPDPSRGLPHSGRSPRGRGRRPDGVRETPARGKIPARAGTTEPPALLGETIPEDPRAGGDDGSRCSRRCRLRGRSPRGRGRPMTRGSFRERSGKIPARAGTTGRATLTLVVRREDPRAGGDDLVRGNPHVDLDGRSPRGRGRPPVRAGVHAGEGKIPARAGTTRATAGEKA